MALSVGTRLGPYEILAPLGAGGMGEVYRARDTRLGREVAVKVLPDAFARDTERLARFEREARVLASLNHPHVATLYGFEQEAETRFLVMELVGGEDLAARLKRGPLRLREALPLFLQVAEGLEAAHEHGIIHRDLKPANIKVTEDGTVKILDFGLAKAAQPAAAVIDDDLSASPTLSATHHGEILGTAAYMSPEQAQGQAVDKRTDIWAFGCCLYEALTGFRVFQADTAPGTLARVLEREPEWQALPDKTPARIRDLLRRCLEKGPRQRLHDIADARLEIAEAVQLSTIIAEMASERVDRSKRWRELSLRMAILAGGTLLGGLGVWLAIESASPPSGSTRRFNVSVAPASRVRTDGYSSPVALSPDGSRVAFVGETSRGPRLFLRSFGVLKAQAIPYTEHAQSPFFSPDGRWLGFWQEERLKKVRLDGTQPVTLCDAPEPGGASWGEYGTIVFNPKPGAGLWRVSANGGTPEQIVEADREEAGELEHPQILPGERAVIFTIMGRSGRQDDSRIAVVSLETDERRVLLEGGTHARYVPTGHLIYGSYGTLFAAPFDLDRLLVGGAAIPVLGDVWMAFRGGGVVSFDFSQAGTLLFLPAFIEPNRRTLVWVDRQGGTKVVTPDRRNYQRPRLSPDGRRLAVQIWRPRNSDLWVTDLTRGSWTRLADEKDNECPVWSPDGTRLVFSSNRAGPLNLFEMQADAVSAPERLLKYVDWDFPSAWSPDGRLIVFERYKDTGTDIWVLSTAGGHQARPLLTTRFQESGAVVSPDGLWLAYDSDETGRSEVYVIPFPDSGPKTQISIGGGREPLWARSGRELFYRNGLELLSVPVQTGKDFSAGSPRLLFEGRFSERGNWGPPSYDVTPDDQRFVMVEIDEDQPSLATDMVVIPNWFEELKEKMREATSADEGVGP